MQQYVAYFICRSGRYSNLTKEADPDFLVKHIALDYAYEIAKERAKARIARVDRSEYGLPRMTEQERNTPLPIENDVVDMLELIQDYKENPEKYKKHDSAAADPQNTNDPDSPKD